MPTAARLIVLDPLLPGPFLHWISFCTGSLRHADGFLLPTEELRGRVLEDRNEPTPTAVIDPTADPAEVACLWTEALATFPPHRAARKSIFRSILEAMKSR